MNKNTPAGQSGTPSDALKTEQTRLLYSTLPAAIAINVLLALVLVSTQYAVISSNALTGWLAILTAVLLGRTALLLAWRLSGMNAKDDSCWLRRFRIAVIATGMAWGAGAVLLFPSNDIDHQSYLAFALAGLSAGGIASLAVDRVSTFGFLLPMLLPLIVRFGLEGGKLSLSMGMMVALFMVFITINASRGRRSLHENFRLRISAEEHEQRLQHSEERLNQAQRTARIGNWELDLVGNELFWSDEIYRIFEIDRAAFKPSYEAFINAIHPDDREAVNQAYTRSLELQAPYEISHRLLMSDGRIKWVTERGVSFFDAQGMPMRSVGTVQDVTEHKQTEQTLQESEEQYRTLFDAVSDFIFLHRTGPENLRGQFVAVNQVACLQLGYSAEELLLMKPGDINLPGYPRNMTAIKQQIASAGHAIFESIYVTKDGRQFPVEISARRILYHGEPMMLSVVRDISERKQTEIEREEHRRDMTALLNAIQESTFLMERNGTMRVLNEVCAQRLNTSPDALAGKNVYEFLPPEVAQTRRAKFEHIARTGMPEILEDERAGRHFVSTIYPVRDAGGEVSRFAVYAADVTQQRHMLAIESLFPAINQKVLQGIPLPELLHFICAEVTRLFDMSLIWVGRKDADGAVSILAHAGPAAGYMDDLQRIGVRWDDTPQGQGGAGRAIRSGQVQHVNLSDPGFKAWREPAQKHGFQSMLGIPLVLRGEVYGAFTLYSGKPDAFPAATTDLLAGIATRICVALEAAMDQQQIRLLSSALAEAGNGVMITSPNGIIQWVNPAFVRLSGYSQEELIGQTPRILKSGQQSREHYQMLWEAISKGEGWCGDTVERARDGSLYTVSQTITPMLDEDGRITHFIAIHEDITAQKKTQERIQHMAHYDALTGLPNRALFYDRLKQAVAMARRNHGGLTLLFMDLDGFKGINDTLGHRAGDLLLKAVAERLHQCVRDSDTVARLGGDEFTAILNEVHEQHSAARIAEKIIAAIAQPFDLEGASAQIGVSIGIAFCSTGETGEDELVHDADQAMYMAKSAGKNTYRFGPA